MSARTTKKDGVLCFVKQLILITLPVLKSSFCDGEPRRVAAASKLRTGFMLTANRQIV